MTRRAARGGVRRRVPGAAARYACAPVLTLDAVSKSFGPRPAVDGLSLALRPGEVLGLLGPNGAGKSTTIAMAVGLLTPDAGSVRVRGAGPPGGAGPLVDLGPPTRPAARRNLGLCPQAIALYPNLTGAENLKLFGRLAGLSRGEAARRAEELLRLVNLEARGADRVQTYSGGMARRLNIAAALVSRPGVVLLDEPTVGVDPHSRSAIFELVEALRAAGHAVLYTTHYMEEAQRLCDRVAVMDQGRLLALGAVDELIASHGGASVLTIDRASGPERIVTADPLGELVRLGLTHLPAAGDRGGRGGPAERAVTGVRIDRPSLEAVFLNLTGRSLRDHER